MTPFIVSRRLRLGISRPRSPLVLTLSGLPALALTEKPGLNLCYNRVSGDFWWLQPVVQPCCRPDYGSAAAFERQFPDRAPAKPSPIASPGSFGAILTALAARKPRAPRATHDVHSVSFYLNSAVRLSAGIGEAAGEGAARCCAWFGRGLGWASFEARGSGEARRGEPRQVLG
jgi:hypothetical protein